MAQRENRWMSDVNHCLSKTLVNHYGENTLFVLEDLANVSFDEKNQSTRDRNRDLHSWSFYDLQTKLTYKAKSQRSQVLIVSAKYTSQRCPKCGQIRKANRNHVLHLYQCKYCGFTTNDDRVGAMNLYDLGKRYLGGEEKPKYTLNNVTD
jgi:IS605 OrfB family transposase